MCLFDFNQKVNLLNGAVKSRKSLPLTKHTIKASKGWLILFFPILWDFEQPIGELRPYQRWLLSYTTTAGPWLPSGMEPGATRPPKGQRWWGNKTGTEPWAPGCQSRPWLCQAHSTTTQWSWTSHAVQYCAMCTTVVFCHRFFLCNYS